MKTLLSKLKINAEQKILVLNAEDSFVKSLKQENTNVIVNIQPVIKEIAFIFYFTRTQNELEKEFESVLKQLNKNGRLAVCFPKGKSKIQTDLTRDKGWDIITKNNALRWITLVSINDNWSAFLLRYKTEKETFEGLFNRAKKDTSYFDAIKKEVYPPEFIINSLRKNKTANTYFNSLSYSHKKEYVSYILDAKKDETRLIRTEKVILQLLNNSKELENKK